MGIVLGIDPGLANTGYGLIEVAGNRHRHIEHGVLRTAAGQPKGKRFISLYEQLDAVIRKTKPDEAGIEKIFFARNSKTALLVAEAKGVILLCLAQNGIAFSEYTPLQVKQAVLGRGKAEKKQIQMIVKLIFRLDELPKPDDAADALAVALCHAHYSPIHALARAAQGRHD